MKRRNLLNIIGRDGPLPSVKKKNIILIEYLEGPNNTVKIVHLANFIAQKYNAKLESVIHDFDFFSRFMRLLHPRRKKYSRLFQSFGCWKWNAPRLPKAELCLCRERAKEIFDVLKEKGDLLSLKDGGIVIGDLIYDYYLRDTGSYTVDLSDKRLYQTIYKALLMRRIYEVYFQRNSVSALVLFHKVYLSMGILVRHAYKNNIPVFSLVGGPKLAFCRSSPNMPHTYNYQEYKRIFDGLDGKEEKRAKARMTLEKKFSGGKIINYGQAYSGYKNPDEGVKVLKQSTNPKILVFLHCFDDAPHGYREMIFCDFWEWINFLLYYASQTDFEWYVKPHPGTVGTRDGEVIPRLKVKYPKINFLNKQVSNLALIREGVKALFNVHGTVGHEFAYFDIPVVNAGDNPHISFDFNIHCKTKDELREAIYSADRLSVNCKKEDIEAFFYMHHFYYDDRLESIDFGDNRHQFGSAGQNMYKYFNYLIHDEGKIFRNFEKCFQFDWEAV